MLRVGMHQKLRTYNMRVTARRRPLIFVTCHTPDITRTVDGRHQTPMHGSLQIGVRSEMLAIPDPFH